MSKTSEERENRLAEGHDASLTLGVVGWGMVGVGFLGAVAMTCALSLENSPQGPSWPGWVTPVGIGLLGLMLLGWGVAKLAEGSESIAEREAWQRRQARRQQRRPLDK